MAARPGRDAGKGYRIQADAQGTEATGVSAEERIVRGAGSDAGEVCGQGGGSRIREAVDPPAAGPGGHHQAMAAQVGEMFGHLDLIRAQHLLKVTDAKRPLQQKMD
ncbi:MAG: hypothetical protein RLZZ447_1503 [Verrucomicrobiota bacterium]|jgi:hypothetical protein